MLWLLLLQKNHMAIFAPWLESHKYFWTIDLRRILCFPYFITLLCWVLDYCFVIQIPQVEYYTETQGWHLTDLKALGKRCSFSAIVLWDYDFTFLYIIFSFSRRLAPFFLHGHVKFNWSFSATATAVWSSLFRKDLMSF